MIGIIVGTHGKFSEEIIRSSEMIFGKQENVKTVTFEPGEGPEDLLAKYEKALSEMNTEDGVIVMVDLFGGSPFNAASRLVIENEKMDIVTGVSLPMLLETFGVREVLPIEEVINTAINAGKDGIKSFKQGLLNSEEEEL
ncbi:PTS sugar transporter subunit IIA [Clostridium frigidicarnis]|uniref:PTS system, mannose-specific IIA component n=1 Tax=Clostridium frigidicarnis TaxID=84698 RepID=A0A1I0VZJ1_9CLOT|nr:mannose/fructose/sorbose PTS transporter subunit IIA [Clostridium frigidicarnis]SFA81792.1 PTS system, mannose-specific IIA component [Clostridium frigidicarnis]